MRKKIMPIINGVLFVVMILTLIVGSVILVDWTTKSFGPREAPIRDTGRKVYACAKDWREDKVIETCKWYPVYEKE